MLNTCYSCSGGYCTQAVGLAYVDHSSLLATLLQYQDCCSAVASILHVLLLPIQMGRVRWLSHTDWLNPDCWPGRTLSYQTQFCLNVFPTAALVQLHVNSLLLYVV